ncbi:MAG: hypothetical protein JEY99_21825 [Spirochaetales bacterium]|nr:hypothetical protein [Spirochaetales bacterium]
MNKYTLICLLCFFGSFLLSSQEQKTITVIDFETSDVSRQEMVLFVDYLSEILSDYDEYQLIDRRQREILLEETRFSNSGCVDETCAIEIGEFLSATEMIIGTLGKLGADIIINLRLIDIRTGKVLSDVTEGFNNIDELVDNCNLVLGKLLRYDEDLLNISPVFHDQKLQILPGDSGYLWNDQLFQPKSTRLMFLDMTESITSNYTDDKLIQLHLEYSTQHSLRYLGFSNSIVMASTLTATSVLLHFMELESKYVITMAALGTGCIALSVYLFNQIIKPPQEFIDYYNEYNPF